jgi:Kef-type K+ transport system membrane component KefB
MSNPHLALQFFLQLAVILVVCRLVGLLAARVGQPEVVAEMLAGIVLGPSLFGVLAPEWQQWLFPWDPTQQTRDTQSYLYPISQVGLALYMFVVGMEFRVDIVRQRLKSSIAVSIAGIVAPLLLAAGLAWVFFHHTDLFPEQTTLPVAMLFLGASLSITALPVLARIIQFKKIGNTSVGTVALGAGAVNDTAAWALLAVVLASLDNNWTHAFVNIGCGVAYVAFTILLVQPLLARAKRWMVRDEELTDAGLVAGIALMAAGAWFTDLIGLHAVFGAFVMGAAMPRGKVVEHLTAHIKPLTVGLLLPLFFTYSGLNTKINLLNTWTLWLMCAAVLVVAIAGKGVACWLAARATGIPNREALGIGTLMNARGLMELIIINIGLQRGIISEGLFATLVIMAVVTTIMTSPLFDWVMGKKPLSEHEPETSMKDAHPLI